MKVKNILGSVADQQMDKFWEEYRRKLAPVMKHKQEDDEDEDIPRFVVTKVKITGYVTHNNEEPPKKSQWERIKQILKPMLIWTAIWFAFIEAIKWFTGHK